MVRADATRGGRSPGGRGLPSRVRAADSVQHHERDADERAKARILLLPGCFDASLERISEGREDVVNFASAQVHQPPLALHYAQM